MPLCFRKMGLALVPEVFNAIDMIVTINKVKGMIDAKMSEPRYIQALIGTIPTFIDNTIRFDLVHHNGFQYLT